MSTREYKKDWKVQPKKKTQDTIKKQKMKCMCTNANQL